MELKLANLIAAQSPLITRMDNTIEQNVANASISKTRHVYHSAFGLIFGFSAARVVLSFDENFYYAFFSVVQNRFEALTDFARGLLKFWFEI